MNNETIIKAFGHRSPDTDATSSAIVWAWFLNTHRQQKAQAYILGETNTETDFVLEHWGFALPPLLEEISEGDRVAIVDTNNLDELFPNINNAHIVSIVDHHKLAGNLSTSHPPEIVIQPYACTMTVMYNIMNIEVNELPENIAGLMLSGILSDTLEFRSPTTTETDIQLAKKLAVSLDVHISDYATEMFNAKSDISHILPKDLVRLDSKIYEVQGKKVRVSVIESTNPSIALEKYDDIVNAFPKVAQEDEIDDILFFVIDILNQEAHFFIHNDFARDIARNAFQVEVTENDKTVVLPGVVSRKKQIIPVIS